MNLASLHRANRIQERLSYLRKERGVWADAVEMHCKNMVVSSSGEKWMIDISLIDFTQLKNDTLKNIDSQIKALEEEFNRL